MISSAYTFGGSYNIDKCEFLEIWHAVREKALIPKNVTSSWQKSGILQKELGNGTLDRDVVSSQLPPEVEKPQILNLARQLHKALSTQITSMRCQGALQRFRQF
jgi:hypothetical protein